MTRMKEEKNVQIFKSLILISMLAVSLFLNGCSSIANGENNKEMSSNKNVIVNFIDTGNSDAILIKDGDTFALIDGGDNDDEKFIVDYLKKQGVKSIKYLISSHPHADHLGGLDAVVKNFDIENVFVANGSAETKSYRDFIYALSDKDLSPSVPLENNKFYLEDSYFEVLNTNGGSNTNDQSLVLIYTNGEDKMLFTGDAEEETEKEILSRIPDVDLLKVGHHGSRSSSTKEFLNKANPEYAVILSAKGNSYGHPHKETMQKLKDMGIEVHRSDECSHIMFESTGNGIFTNCKEGSYKEGVRDNNTNTYKSNKTGNNNSSNKSYNNKSDNKEYKNNETKVESVSTVYFTSNGKSYHSRQDCSALVNSKKILSGTIEESGKYDPCDRCYGK